MEKFLVSIRLLFFLAVAIITFLATRPHGYGYQCTEILHVYH